MSNPAQPWHAYAKAAGFSIEPGGLLVEFADGRSHRLHVFETDHTWLLRGLVVRQATRETDSTPALSAALKNRHSRMYGLRVDRQGRLVGETHVPKPGLTPVEFQLHARHLAAECDRLEYLITGLDREARGREK